MIPRRLLEKLAPVEPLIDGEYGNCLHCDATPAGPFAGRFLDDHAPGCPWVKARRLLGDRLARNREKGPQE